MSISIYNDFSEYMVFKGVKSEKATDFKYKDIDVDITEELIIKQLGNIYDFHGKSMGFNGYLRSRLDNNTGKIIEDYKIYNKRLTSDVKQIKRNGPENSFEKLVVKYGEVAIKRGEACIEEVYDKDYIGIISRSMRRGEICLGNTDFRNLRKDNFTYVVSFQDCSYNMVEMDCIVLLGKLKRRGLEVDFRKLAGKFCDIEGLDANSLGFILALVSYPYEFMRCCTKYRKYKNKDNEDKFTKKLFKAVSQDGDSLF